MPFYKAPAREITHDCMVTGRERACVLISLLGISGAWVGSKRERLRTFLDRTAGSTDCMLPRRHPQAAAGSGVRLCGGMHLEGVLARPVLDST